MDQRQRQRQQAEKTRKRNIVAKVNPTRNTALPTRHKLGNFLTTPREPLSARLLKHCATISPEQPVFLPFTQFDPRYIAGQCHANVFHYVRGHGGRRVNGWMIWESIGMDDAEFHSVWQSSDGTLIDITPRKDKEKLVLFLPDPVTRLRLGRDGDSQIQPTNRTNLPGLPYTVGNSPWATSTAVNRVEPKSRAYVASLGLDTFAACSEEGF